MSKNKTMEQAILLFKVFGFKEFGMTILNKTNLKVTEEDLRHIMMFNCLERVKTINRRGLIVNRRKGRITNYIFTKEPKYEEG